MKENLYLQSLLPTRYSLQPAQGFTMIELLIATFIVGTVIVGVFGLFVLGIRSGQEGERRVVGLALANERAEMIRNLPYQTVGTQNGIPAGSIAQEETIVRNSNTYTVKTDIRYVDDTFDGTAGGNPHDTVNTDYKQARIEVTWRSQVQPKPIVLLLTIAPAGLEGGPGLGTLSFQALNSSGTAVASATVEVTNSSVSPAIDITTQTDASGRVILPGLPPSSETYGITVTKTGFTTEQTYPSSATFTPDAEHTRLSMVQSQVTPKTFSIDQQSSVTITSDDVDDKKIKDIAYTFRGTKTIGVDNTAQPVYLVNLTGNTGPNGFETNSGVVWDAYDLTIDGVATGYDIKETTYVLPISIAPGTDTDLIMTLVPYTPISLHVTVVNPTNQPIDNATVTVSQGGFNSVLGTGAVGQVLFQDIPSNTTFDITITAPGYITYTGTVDVNGTTRTKTTLTPNP